MQNLHILGSTYTISMLICGAYTYTISTDGEFLWHQVRLFDHELKIEQARCKMERPHTYIYSPNSLPGVLDDFSRAMQG